MPKPLEVQTFDSVCWVGVVPFRMSDVMLRGLPALPSLSTFPELNVRVYVTHDGKPGVWFFSLDADSRLAVWGARATLNLPYHRASIQIRHGTDRTIRYRARRCQEPLVSLKAVYRPVSNVYRAAPGSLDEFLVERYCLYGHFRNGGLYRLQIQHAPWPLQRAEGEIDPRSMLAPFGMQIETGKPLLHFARRLDVVTWAPERL